MSVGQLKGEGAVGGAWLELGLGDYIHACSWLNENGRCSDDS